MSVCYLYYIVTFLFCFVLPSWCVGSHRILKFSRRKSILRTVMKSQLLYWNNLRLGNTMWMTRWNWLWNLLRCDMWWIRWVWYGTHFYTFVIFWDNSLQLYLGTQKGNCEFNYKLISSSREWESYGTIISVMCRSYVMFERTCRSMAQPRKCDSVRLICSIDILKYKRPTLKTPHAQTQVMKWTSNTFYSPPWKTRKTRQTLYLCWTLWIWRVRRKYLVPTFKSCWVWIEKRVRYAVQHFNCVIVRRVHILSSCLMYCWSVVVAMRRDDWSMCWKQSQVYELTIPSPTILNTHTYILKHRYS